LTHDLANGRIFEGFELTCGERAGSKLRACGEQLGWPQQAADVIGAKGGSHKIR
jgi:hypothetical protein